MAAPQAPRRPAKSPKRAKRPRYIAVVGDECTGCAGSPMCQDYCPVEDCMIFEPDEDHPPFWRIFVEPTLCIGCRQCAAGGSDDINLTGCPWEAIALWPIDAWESVHGPWQSGD